MVIGYESTPVKQIVALMRISAEQDGEKIYFEKLEGLSSTINYATLKECPELEKMEYFVNPQGSLFKLTKGEYEFILDMIRDENPVPSKKDKNKAFNGLQRLEPFLQREGAGLDTDHGNQRPKISNANPVQPVETDFFVVI